MYFTNRSLSLLYLYSLSRVIHKGEVFNFKEIQYTIFFFLEPTCLNWTLRIIKNLYGELSLPSNFNFQLEQKSRHTL